MNPQIFAAGIGPAGIVPAGIVPAGIGPAGHGRSARSLRFLFRNTPARNVAAAMALGALAVASPGLAAGPAQAAEPTSIHLTYDFEGNGFRIMRLRFAIKLDGDTYEASSVSETKGIASIFSGDETTASAQGSITRRGLVPKAFEMRAKKSSKTQKFKLAWQNDGRIDVRRNYKLDKFKAKLIDETVRPGMPDPISGLLHAAMFNSKEVCSGRQRVYNGKVIYDLSYTLKGEDSFGDNMPGVYRGKAYQCQIEYRPVAGFSKGKMREMAKDPVEPFKVWMAPVTVAAYNKTLMIPVRIEGNMDFISAVGTAREATINGKPLNAQSHAKR